MLEHNMKETLNDLDLRVHQKTLVLQESAEQAVPSVEQHLKRQEEYAKALNQTCAGRKPQVQGQ